MIKPQFRLKRWTRPHVLLSQHQRWRKEATLLKLSAAAQHRLDVLIWLADHDGNLSLTSRHFGHPRKVIRDWRKQFDTKNLRTLELKSRRPQHVRSWTVTPDEEQRILALRRAQMHWGKKKLAVVYAATHGMAISTWKVERVIRAHHLYPNPVRHAKLVKKRLAGQKKKRITEFRQKPGRLGQLIHLDGIVIWWEGLRRVIFTVIDDLTKIGYARMYPTSSSRNAADFLRRFLFLIDVPVPHVHSDNGSEFHKEFQALCRELRISQWWSRPRTPKDNPSLERFNQTLQYEWLNDGHFTPDCERFNVALTDWLLIYNFHRPHETLAYKTPIQYAIDKHQLAPMSSARTSA